MSAMDRSPELDWTGNGPLMWILWAVMHYAYVRQIFCLEAWGEGLHGALRTGRLFAFFEVEVHAVALQVLVQHHTSKEISER